MKTYFTKRNIFIMTLRIFETMTNIDIKFCTAKLKFNLIQISHQAIDHCPGVIANKAIQYSEFIYS